ncbi:MAG: amidohydrolase [Verrucomicrobia bacterium]|nr:amidohydrolase [Verrucomicrobiota bacterium]
MIPPRSFSRREFLVSSAAALAAAPIARAAAAPVEPIIDIHQHTNYGGPRDPKQGWKQIGPARSDADMIAHQRAMGITTTILLPAGTPMVRPSTLNGQANGLDTTCFGNDSCLEIARAHPGEFLFAANEVPDADGAATIIEKYLKLGAVMIAEQKFGVQCDSSEMQRLFELAGAYRVPILMHWQAGSYNLGYDRFHRMLAKYPKTNFIGHAQTFWANIDKANVDNPKALYPKGKVSPGGLTDRYLADYPNFFGDLSAGSGENAFKRDPEQARAFLTRHQDKLLYGSDCNDRFGTPEVCSGIRQLAQIREWAPNKAAARKMLYENSKKLFRL